jgi:hypothetical protein
MIFCGLVLRSSDPGMGFLWCLIGFCSGIGLFFYGFKLLQRRRLILDTPFSKIRSAAMGMVEVSGLAVGPYTMIAPITAKPCYYYRTVVWEWKREGKNSKWVKVAGECMHLPFFVDDNTGRLLVDPRGADLDIHRDFQQEFCDSFFTTKEPAPSNVRSFLERHGISTNNKIKVEEFCIKPKNSLFMLGTLAENPGLEVTKEPIHDAQAIDISSTGGYASKTISISFSTNLGGGFDPTALAERMISALPNATQTQVVRLSSKTMPANIVDMSQQEKVSAALLKAGISNPAAWSAAGLGNSAVQVIEDPSFTSSQSASRDGKAIAFDPHPPVVLMKGSNNKTFLISWRSQQDVARSLGWKCALMIWGGPALALLSLYLLLSIENWL